MTRTLIRWSFIGGIVVAALLLLLALTAPKVFTPDVAVQRALFWALLVLLVAQPLAGYVFVLDGVFMGAGDARYLGLAGVVTMAAYVPVAGGLWFLADDGIIPTDWEFSLATLWGIFTAVFLGARALTLWWRSRTNDRMHLE